MARIDGLNPLATSRTTSGMASTGVAPAAMNAPLASTPVDAMPLVVRLVARGLSPSIRAMGRLLVGEVGGDLEHLVADGEGLQRGLVRPLRDEHVGEFLGRIDVRAFERAGHDGCEAGTARGAGRGRTGVDRVR